MGPVLDRLRERESAIHGDLARLHDELEMTRKKIADTEEQLRRIQVTRETLMELGGDEVGFEEATVDEPTDSDAAAPAASSEAGTGQVRGTGAADGRAASGRTLERAKGPFDLQEGRQRILSVLATCGPAMKAREVAEAIGEDVSTPARVETTRAG
ncbi:hypothetical protein ACTWQF_34525 [Streptomyces sp. 8N114]|uniref:hypothetical protein n=1 Tax=Streptomyces sp. 8N114 TaxID=3457419 RepID=UPI003FD66FEC